MARRMQLLALLACCLIVAGLAPVTESTAIWNEMVSTDKGVWYQAAFYEYPIPNLQGAGGPAAGPAPAIAAGPAGAIDQPADPAFGRKLLEDSLHADGFFSANKDGIKS